MVSVKQNSPKPCRVVLVRCRPERAGAVTARELESDFGGPRIVFFQGEGAGHGDHRQAVVAWNGLAERFADTRLILCETSWQRRRLPDQDPAGADSGEFQPPPGWTIGSLVMFWDEALDGSEIDCYGASW